MVAYFQLLHWYNFSIVKQFILEEESSDKHSSDDDTEVSSEVWTITPEQKDYYTKQFQNLQENTNGLLAGPVARTFFERYNRTSHISITFRINVKILQFHMII